MTTQEFLNEAARLEIAARTLGFSVGITARINAMILLAIEEKRQMDCHHTDTRTWNHTYAGGRDEVTACNECGKELSRKAV